MTTEKTKKQPPILACSDDKVFIKRMKQLGIWKKMKEQSKLGKTITILTGFELFIWHGVPGDSGYTFFKSDNPGELIMLAGRALGDPIVDSKTKH